MGPDHWAPKMREKMKYAKQFLIESRKGFYLNNDKFYHDN